MSEKNFPCKPGHRAIVFAAMCRRICSWLVCALILSGASSRATVFVWNGAGSSGNWSDVGNWSFMATPPTNGDTLIFPAFQPRPISTNDIANLTMNQIRYLGSNYVVYGNAFTITNSIVVTNTTGTDTISVSGLTLATTDVTMLVSNAATLTISAAIGGSVGVVKNGAGTLLLNGPNSNIYLGTTTVNGGTVQLQKAGFPLAAQAIPGNLVIGNGTNAATVQNIYGSEFVTTANVTINSGGLWDMNGASETIGTNLTFNGNANLSDGGSLTLTAPSTITVNGGTSSINGTGSIQLGAGPCGINVAANNTLNVYPSVQGAAAITKTGQGNLYLYGANTYTGLTTVSQGWLWAENSLALGTTNSGTVVNSGATLVLAGNIGITNESLTLNGYGEPGWTALDCEFAETNIWAGPITLTADSNTGNFNSLGRLRIIGPISGSGGLLEDYSSGTLSLEGLTANTFAGLMTVNAGTTLLLNNSAYEGAISKGLDIFGTVRLAQSSQTSDSADVNVESGGLFDFSAFNTYLDTLHGTGTVNFGVNGWIYIGLNNGSSEFDGSFTGTGFSPGWTVGKTGSGTFKIGGNSTYTTGVTHDYNGGGSGGKLVINGSQPKIPVIVDVGTTLGGSGTVSTITANGVISPGNSPGILNSSNVTFSSTGNFTVELTGPNPGAGGYDQLNVTGTVSLANATLTVIPAFTTPVAIGQQFVILNNDMADAITGTFSGLAQGATISTGGYNFTISYVGGTGNDVVLTLISIPGAVAGSAVTSGDGSHGIDPNGCNNLSLVITNTTATPMTGVNATLSTTTEGVLITQPYATYPDMAANGTGTNFAPFQISTLTNFACGTPISLQLSLDSSLGSFTMNYTLNSGEPATPSRYDVTGNVAIPDIGTVDSTNVVSGFTSTPLLKVVVSLYITHPYDSDLTNISLISPDGTTVLLSSANGGSGQNYGSGLTPDSDRTTFDDAAATPITAGTAPFVGTYSPQSALAAFINNATPNGSWHLHIADGFGGSLGTLRGWSLFLYGTGCSTGSGACDYCLTSISGVITNTDLVQTNRMTRNGVAASCGAPKAWPGFFDSLPGSARHYDIYSFTNTSPADACVTVVLTSPGDVQAGIYTNAFTPSNISSNYLADAGVSTGNSINTPVSCSSEIPAGGIFFVTVNEVTPNTGSNYVLQISGLPCPPPPLAIDPLVPAPAMRLHWPTWAGGYNLEANTNLGTTVWTGVTNEPIVNSGNFAVTNNAASGNNFYRLHKP